MERMGSAASAVSDHPCGCGWASFQKLELEASPLPRPQRIPSFTARHEGRMHDRRLSAADVVGW